MIPHSWELNSELRRIRKFLGKIIRSLAADAIEDKKTSLTASIKDAEEFVSKICDSKIVELGSLGLGTQYKINADSHLGQTLLFHTKLIHFIVFNNRDWVQ